MSTPIKCPKCKTRLKKLGDYKKNIAGVLCYCPKCDQKMVKNNWYGYLTIVKNDESGIETEKTNEDSPIREKVNPISKTKPLLVIRHYY